MKINLEKAREYNRKQYKKMREANPKFCTDCGELLHNYHLKRCPKCKRIHQQTYQQLYFQANKKRIADYRRDWWRTKAGKMKIEFQGEGGAEV